MGWKKIAVCLKTICPDVFEMYDNAPYIINGFWTKCDFCLPVKKKINVCDAYCFNCMYSIISCIVGGNHRLLLIKLDLFSRVTNSFSVMLRAWMTWATSLIVMGWLITRLVAAVGQCCGERCVGLVWTEGALSAQLWVLGSAHQSLPMLGCSGRRLAQVWIQC